MKSNGIYRILHLADIHLDASFAGIGLPPEVARRHRAQLRETLSHICAMAKEKQVNCVTIAGDLYEQERFTGDTAAWLVSLFKQLGSIPVFIAPGNHDPFVADSLYSYVSWPPNVTIFSSQEFEPIALTQNLTLWGMAHTSPSQRKKPLASFKVPKEGKHILLFHGSDTGGIPEGKMPHAPFTLQELEATGALLALVGHYHTGKWTRGKQTQFCYPGSIEPLGFGEKSPHSAALIEITDSETPVSVEFIPVNRLEFSTFVIQVNDISNSEELKDKVRQALTDEPVDKNTYVRIVLTGERQTHVEIDGELLSEMAMEFCRFALVQDKTTPALDILSMQEEQTVRGEFVRALLKEIEKADADEREKLQKALYYGIHAFEGKPIVLLNR